MRSDAESVRGAFDVTVDRFRVRVEEQLRPIETVPLFREERPPNPVPIPLTGSNSGKVSVPDGSCHFGQIETRLGITVEYAELDTFAMLREHREVGSLPVPTGSQWILVPGPELHTAAA